MGLQQEVVCRAWAKSKVTEMRRSACSAAVRRRKLTIITEITLLQGKETHLAAMYHRRGVGAGCCSGAVTSAYPPMDLVVCTYVHTKL